MFWSSLRRMAHILAVLVKHVLAYVFGKHLARWPRLEQKLPIGLSGPERLRAVIEEIGGTFIKFGQMLALQPDVLPLEYCNALFNLLDRVAPFEIEQVEKTFIEEFGRSPSEIFDSFDSEPIATASIGQVHVAYLDGRKLAVKVQRPSVHREFAGDIRVMTTTIRLIRRLRLKMLYWMVEPASEFIAWTEEELDYRREARYMQRQQHNAKKNPHEHVPAVVWQYTSRRTLAVEFVEGVSVLDYLRATETGNQLVLHRLKAMSFDPDQFVRNILDNFLGDAYRYGMFHADLHPANLMILPHNAIGYIDFGITGVLSRYSRQSLVALTLGLGSGDLDAMCATFFRISAMDANSDIEGFREGLKELALEWYEVKGKQRRLVKNATLVMFDMLQLSRRTGIYPERDVVKYIRSAIAIDGLITRAVPGFDLGQHLEIISAHYLKWHARQSLFSYDKLLDWSSSSGHLMRDGAFRASSFLQQVSEGRWPIHVDAGEPGTQADGAMRINAVKIAAVILAVALLITVTAERVEFGVNLFTAEVLLFAASAMLLLRTIRKLA